MSCAVFPGNPSSGRPILAQRGIRFLDVSNRLDFIHRSDGGEGLSGAAWFDYNNDGFLDLYLTNGKKHPNGLLRNNGDGSFTNVSAQAGVENGQGNSGVIAGDIDNDGNVDLFLTGEGGFLGAEQSSTKLYHNRGDGTFEDITERARVSGPESALSAAFADIDRDGFLDLYITSPGSLATRTQHMSKLYHNNGNLTFTDVSASAGVDTALGACVVEFSDYDNDGWIDLFVGDCNDVYYRPTPLELFRNNGNLTFTNVTAKAGLAGGGFWMGITLGDYDNDGDIDIFATNLGTFTPFGRFHALYENNGNGTYTNVGERAGVARWEWGWGCSFADFDNDGHIDLFFAGSFPPFPYGVIGRGKANPGRLLMNNHDKTFTEIGASQGFDLSDQYTSGVAVGDFDGNGFSDIVVGIETYLNQIGRPLLYQNMGNGNHWLIIKTVGTTSNRDGVGARIRVRAGDLMQLKERYAGSSFLSMDSPWLTFGLGPRDRADSIEITWPSGRVDHFESVTTGRAITLVEGRSTAF